MYNGFIEGDAVCYLPSFSIHIFHTLIKLFKLQLTVLIMLVIALLPRKLLGLLVYVIIQIVSESEFYFYLIYL